MIKKLFANKKFVASLTSMVLTLFVFVAIVITMFSTKAWFASNKDVGGSGISVSAAREYLLFGDEITAKAVMSHTTIAEGNYKRFENSNNYYLYRDGDFVKDDDGNYRPLSYSSLYPGEFIEISLTISCDESHKGMDYTLYFSGLSQNDNEEGSFTVGEKTYSVLGVYKIVPCTVSEDGTVTEDTTNSKFIVDYSADTTVSDTCEITSGTMTETTMSVTFRLYVDLTQYKGLGAATNALSEKTINLDGIVLAPKEAE